MNNVTPTNNVISVTVFIKNGNQRNIQLPLEFINELTTSIKHKGSETIHLSSGDSLEVTGILIAGSDFHKEERVILTGIKGDD